ncbi:hypothetical protein [Alteromonas facilis]|uniref:hypothetical protein n=1 Tax=Alteromonas facilis TaxID=2048004 RepID=UPI000C28B78D|nr:hypothetical protein [Alteromonas facilis]
MKIVKKLLMTLFLLLIIGAVAASGWYLVRLLSVSAYEDKPWVAQANEPMNIMYKAVDTGLVVEFQKTLNLAAQHVETYFQRPFAAPLEVHLMPDRAALDAHWRKAFGMPWFISTCWMVGTGAANDLSILSPRIWAEEDCGHDPTNEVEIFKLLVHELTHSYHDQANPSDDIGIYEDIGWFIEGLAVHVSNQLEGDQLASPAEAIIEGMHPKKLEAAWSGKYRYGISGSMVEYIETVWGKDVVRQLLEFTTEEDILSTLQVSEQAFIGGWKEYVLSNDNEHD